MKTGRNLVIGTIAAALVVALLLVTFLGENARMAKTAKAQEGTFIARGARLYDGYCAGCHGKRGEGLPGIYPPLNIDLNFEGRENLAFYGTLHDYISLNVSAGHPSQNMPSWSEEYGGPLRNDQIESVTAFVLNWQGPQPEGVRIEGVEAWTKPAEGAAPPDEPLEPAGEGDPASGEAIFVQNCSSCHGETAEGGALGPSLVREDLGGQDDAFFQDAIANGRAGTAMPPWGGVLGGQDIADVISFLRSKQ